MMFRSIWKAAVRRECLTCAAPRDCHLWICLACLERKMKMIQVNCRKHGISYPVGSRCEQCDDAAEADKDAAFSARRHHITYRTVPVYVAPGYDSLFNVLTRALEQAQIGKGKERHAQPDTAFEDQPIIQIGRMVGMGFQNGQAIKKMVEAQGMLARGEFNAAEREVLGAIVYMSAVCIEINKRATAQMKGE